MFKLVTFTFLLAAIQPMTIFAQNNCPDFPKYGKFDTLSYIKTEIPTDTKNGKLAGNIYLGEGNVKIPNRPSVNPVFIPANKPTWALAVAHAWNYERNIIKRVNYPQIGSYLATVLQETELACVTGTTWDSPAQIPPSMANASMVMNNGGCYQLEGPASAYQMLSMAFPMGRFPNASYNTLIQGTTGFETSALSKAYWGSYQSMIFNYNVGWKLFESIDCAMEKYAYVQTIASGWNTGMNGFSAASGYYNRSQDNVARWTGLPSAASAYPESIASWTSVLENDVTYNGYPAGSSFQDYYNKNITWQIVTDYLTIIQYMYPEINFSTNVIPKVQNAFVKIAGSTSASIPFMKMGPVIDQIILALPAEYPTLVDGAPAGANKICSGTLLPYGHIEIQSGSTDLQSGESVTFNIAVDNGYSDALTYKWFEGTNTTGTPIATSQQLTVNTSQSGTTIYVAQVCKGANCYQLATNALNACTDPSNSPGVQVNSTNNSTCNFSASATSVAATCKGMKNGTVSIQLLNAPASYNASYTATTSNGTINEELTITSGNTIDVTTLADGTYTFKFVNQSDPGCYTLVSVTVGYNTNTSENVTAQITSTQNCIAEVEANIVVTSAPCNFKIQAWAPIYLQWENNIYLGTQINDQSINIDSWNRLAAKPEIDPWLDAQISERVVRLNSGDDISLSLHNNSSTSSQMYGYTVRILDGDNTVVKTFNVSAGSAQYGVGAYEIGSYTVTCPVPSPTAYTFAWSPAISAQTDSPAGNAIQSTGNVPVSGTADLSYTVTAISDVNSACQYTNTIVIPADATCTITGIEEAVQKDKVLVRIYNLFGQEVLPQNAQQGIFIYKYSDGSTEKILK